MALLRFRYFVLDSIGNKEWLGALSRWVTGLHIRRVNFINYVAWIKMGESLASEYPIMRLLKSSENFEKVVLVGMEKRALYS